MKKNIVEMFFIKGGSIAINMMLVPLTLTYVNSNTYGIWLTLSSMVAWISFFDIGINNGLKNKLAEAFAHDNYILGKKYVSTTYALLCSIFIPILFMGLIACPFVNWYSILNLSYVEAPDLIIAVSIVISYFCIQFILSTINIILLADQRPAESSFRTLIQQALSFFIIACLVLTTKGSLAILCVGLCLAPILVLAVFSISLFKGRYRNIAPSLTGIDVKVVPLLMKHGAQFFVIQIAGIIQFQMLNFIIMRYYGAESVTSYNVAHKYFALLYMVWGIVLTPLWVASTDAISKGDYNWLRHTVRGYVKFYMILAVAGGVMLLLSSIVYRIWIADKVYIPYTLSLWVLIHFLVLMFGSIFVYILNGAGILRLQTWASVVSPFLFVFVCYYFISHGVGVYGVILASVIANYNGFLLAPIQYYIHFEKRGRIK